MFLPSPGTWTLFPSVVGNLLVFVSTKAALKEAFHSNYTVWMLLTEHPSATDYSQADLTVFFSCPHCFKLD